MPEEKNFAAYLNRLRQASLPRWADLPQFDLYMDQVVQYVNDIVTPLGLDELTATMVNNYVKKGVITSPLKKKYHRGQLANILVIAMLKPVFALDTIAAGIDYQLQGREKQQAFDAFILAFIGAVQQVNSDFTGEVLINKVNRQDTTNVQSAMVYLAINAVLQKMLVEAMTAMVTPAQPTKKKD
ncbi:DUF1836 domain-containing protein [Lacticaseibacillus parakribbianus]|uniref:DUF1836 domain-containing protein n=1 Tax=Lacticaseibacillus parakribbianus TaxID=2970927 RepID=UPI0021CAE579|nr:DUF1836 domain-containing protein [Lacticaseibacillus parakribbianus]